MLRKKKWLAVVVAAVMVLGLMAGVVGAAYGDYLRTRDLPKGEHFTTNLVTDLSEFNGEMHLYQTSTWNFIEGTFEGNMLSGEVEKLEFYYFRVTDEYDNSIDIRMFYDPDPEPGVKVGDFIAHNGTGIFEGAVANGSFTGTDEWISADSRWEHFRFYTGTIQFPNEILIPKFGSFKNLWKAAPPEDNVYRILDNDATDGLFVVQFPTGMDKWHVFRQIRGKPGSEIKIHSWGYEERVAGKQMWFDWGTYNLSSFAGSSGWFYNDGVTCVSIRWYPNQ